MAITGLFIQGDKWYFSLDDNNRTTIFPFDFLKEEFLNINSSTDACDITVNVVTLDEIKEMQNARRNTGWNNTVHGALVQPVQDFEGAMGYVTGDDRPWHRNRIGNRRYR